MKTIEINYFHKMINRWVAYLLIIAIICTAFIFVGFNIVRNDYHNTVKGLETRLTTIIKSEIRSTDRWEMFQDLKNIDEPPNGIYRHNDKIIIWVKDRSPKAVWKTLNHEMLHHEIWWQENKIDPNEFLDEYYDHFCGRYN